MNLYPHPAIYRSAPGPFADARQAVHRSSPLEDPANYRSFPLDDPDYAARLDRAFAAPSYAACSGNACDQGRRPCPTPAACMLAEDSSGDDLAPTGSQRARALFWSAYALTAALVAVCVIVATL